MVRKAAVLVRDFLRGVVGWIEEKRKRHFEHCSDFFGVGTWREIGSDYRDKRRDQVVVERNDLVNPAQAFHLFGGESDFLLALPQNGFQRRAILRILLASGKGDLARMRVEVRSPLCEKQVQLVVHLPQGDQDRGPLFNLGIERQVQVLETRANPLQRGRIRLGH